MSSLDKPHWLNKCLQGEAPLSLVNSSSTQLNIIGEFSFGFIAVLLDEVGTSVNVYLQTDPHISLLIPNGR